MVANQRKLLDTREGGIETESVNMEAGCVGRRCHLSSVHHSTSAGASVYGRDWNSPFECVNDAGAFLRITSVADKGLVDTHYRLRAINLAFHLASRDALGQKMQQAVRYAGQYKLQVCLNELTWQLL